MEPLLHQAATRRVLLSMLALLPALSGTFLAASVSAQTPFYNAPRSSLAGQPGTIVRQERIDGKLFVTKDYLTGARVYGINFDTNSNVIREESKPTLNQIVGILKEKTQRQSLHRPLSVPPGQRPLFCSYSFSELVSL